jgi:hypothetical protein
MESFDFVFIMHLMIELLSITGNFSMALQRKDLFCIHAFDDVNAKHSRQFVKGFAKEGSRYFLKQ